MRNAIFYRGTWLMPGSHAHKLHTEGKMAALERHMAAVSDAYRKLHGLP